MADAVFSALPGGTRSTSRQIRSCCSVQLPGQRCSGRSLIARRNRLQHGRGTEPDTWPAHLRRDFRAGWTVKSGSRRDEDLSGKRPVAHLGAQSIRWLGYLEVRSTGAPEFAALSAQNACEPEAAHRSRGLSDF